MSERAFRARVLVRLDDNVNDPAGNAVREGLLALGHADVGRVRIGKIVELALEAASPADARARVERMCHDLLANPVIETFEIEVVEGS